MTARFQYQARTPEQIAKRASGNTYEGFIRSEFETFMAKKENQIRILPPTWENPQHYGMDIWVHYGVGPQNASVLCLWKMGGKNCPVCEAHVRAEVAGREDASTFKPTRRVLVWLVDRIFEKEKQQKKCFAWAMPATKVDVEIASICKDRETGQLYYIDDPEHGFDIFFNKEGEKMHVDYKAFVIARRESSIDPWYLDFILANPLPNILQWRSYEEVQTLFEGQPVGKVQIPTQSGSVQETVPPILTPAAFVAEWTGEHCSECSQPQYTCPSGVTCSGGHGNAPSIEELQAAEAAAAAAAAPPVQTAPPPPPAPPAPPAQPAPVAAQPAAPAPRAAAPIQHTPIVVNSPTTTSAPPPAISNQPAAPTTAAPVTPISRVGGLRGRFQTGTGK